MSTTHVLMIADMSGSMHQLADDVRGGFNAYIAGLREDTDNTYKVTVALFDHRYMPLCTAVDLTDVPTLTSDNYEPAGSTALLDAVGLTVTGLTAPLEPGDKVLVVIQTDGKENASEEWTFRAVADLIKSRTAAGNWDFTYLGAGVDSWDQAAMMGIGRAMYVNTANTSEGTAATYTSLVGATRNYAGGQSGAEAVREIRETAGK